MVRPHPSGREVQEREAAEGSEKEYDAHSRGAVRVAGLDLAADEHGRDLGLERNVAGDQHDRAELTQRAGEGEAGTGQDRRTDRGERDPAKGLETACAQAT